MKPFITVMTATYNRANLLLDLYKSLYIQSNKNFIWMIIDDGSTDETYELITSLKSNSNGFLIEYHRIECNGGKNRAINFGVSQTVTPYILIVDSDDYITEDAIEFLVEKGEEVLNDQKLAGIGSLKGKDLQTTLGPILNFGAEYVDVNNLNRRMYGLDKDGCEMYKTSILRRFPFKVWKNEKFSPEEIIWDDIAIAGYSLRWYNKITCMVRYQPEGLSRNWEKLVRDNPMGYYMLYRHRLHIESPFKQRCRNMYAMIAFAIYGNNPLSVFNIAIRYYPLMFALLPIGICAAIKWRLK